MAQKVLGKVTHYYDHLGVAVLKLGNGVGLKKGDKLAFKGNSTDFSQEVKSLQVDRKDVESVKTTDDFGLKVDKPVKDGDQVLAAKK